MASKTQKDSDIEDAYAEEAEDRAAMPKDSPSECGYVVAPLDEVTPALSPCDVLNEDHRWWLKPPDAYRIKSDQGYKDDEGDH